MSYSSAVLADSPLVYWRLGESNGAGIAVDASGNSRDGTYHYGGSGTHLSLGATGLLTGDADTCASFNGSTGDASGVDIAHGSWMDVSSFTIECWIKTTASGFQMLWDRDLGSGQRAWQYRLNSGKFEFVRICNAAGSISAVTASSVATVNDGVAHHLVATYDGSTILLYVDGVLDTTQACSGGITLTATDGLRFGWSFGGASAYGVGFADEPAYYGTVLSGTRIAAHYTAGTTASPDATVLPPAASASAAALAPVVSTTRTVFAVPATATASAPAPAITNGTGDRTVLPPAATATATAPVPVWTQLLDVATDTTNALDGLSLVGVATVTITRAPATAPVTLVLADKFDKAVPYPVPTMVNGRPT